MTPRAVFVCMLTASMMLVGCGSGQTQETTSEEPATESEPVTVTDDETTEGEESSEVAEPTSVGASGVRWELEAVPTTLTMADRADFRIRILATNETAANVDPQMFAGEFQVGGVAHMGLNLWFGNGVRTTDWDDLPPGATARDERAPGEQLFEAPGEYVITYVHGATTATVTVTVTE